MAEHELDFYSPTGEYLTSFYDYLAFEIVASEMAIGAATLSIPASYPDSWFQRDCRLGFKRVLPDGTRKLFADTYWLLSRKRKIIHGDGSWHYLLHFVHPNHVLTRRQVAYEDGTPEADKEDGTPDLMKAYVRENFITASDSTRNIALDKFIVDDDSGGSIFAVTIKGSYKSVFEVLNDAAAQSAQRGEFVGYETMISQPDGPIRFRTYLGQRGLDRTANNYQQVMLTVDSGLENVELDMDWTNTATIVYCGGMGMEGERVYDFAQNKELERASPYARTEVFTSQGDSEYTELLKGTARRRLRKLRPRYVFSGGAVDSVYAPYDIAYTWGDIVLAQVYPLNATDTTYEHFPVRIDPVHIILNVQTDPTGHFRDVQESLDLRLRIVEDGV